MSTVTTRNRPFPSLARRLVTVTASAALIVGAGSVAAQKKAAPAAKPAPAKEEKKGSRTYVELGGKFQWGMSPEEVMGLIEKEIAAKFQPKIESEKEAEKQDAVRREMREAVDQMRNSYIRFNGQKTGWDVSIVDREFGHRNSESMVVMWEKDQRRFLFFWKEKLYKQFIAYNSERFAGKSFEEFVEGMQIRYGKAEMSFTKKQTDDEMALDYYQWPPQGDHVMRAIDQTGFYGNFCLALLHKSLIEQIEKERATNSPPRVRRTNVHVVDSITQGDSANDPNESVIDDVVGKRALPSVEQKRIQERIMKEYQKNKQPAPPPAK
ncbi:MAG TPA: hypothetical protein PKI03_32605 [Pseudomonadota bacterium]|nr:hypothetical protein [Pseudomonadota bacterium]